MDFQQVVFPYRRCADQDAATPARRPVVVVGAGPVGLSLAIDLAQQQVPVLLLDNDDRLSTGSRAICFAKRTLEIFDRLGVGAGLVDKGVSWSTGRVFLRDQPIYSFDLQPETTHERPAFINIQQYYVEGHLVERALALPLIELRWKHEVVGVTAHADGVTLQVQTPDGPYGLHAGHVVACDGARSSVRHLIGEEAKGRTFKDRFLIADVRFQDAVDFPAERWFWFDPPFHPGQSVLLHKQPDGVWRIDFQLGWDADPEAEKRPERILPRVRALLAHSTMKDAQFELEWASVYSFSCERMARFRHGRVLFAGDAAHRVSPFGARGANSGVQDADNLAWKLAAVLQGRAGDTLLDSYGAEREYAADENIGHSTRATDFITPKSEISRLFRDATLQLARDHAFARALVNSGRLSTASTLHGSPLNTADVDAFDGAMVPGATALDAPVRCDGCDGWLLRHLCDGAFGALVFDGEHAADAVQALRQAAEGLAPLQVLLVAAADSVRLPGTRTLLDSTGLIRRRYDGTAGTTYLLRPDQHVCARWRRVSPDAARSALRRAMALQ
ncbi:MAG TPA: FAD-dependent oxidoreductase [Burkholderiaceae bacterium]|nr:FAD-dependent oxidoreductase [Burkholderiaceae bacterium]